MDKAECRIKLLKKFYNSRKLRFNELAEDVPSNFLSYHLKKFLDEGLIEKDGDFYVILPKGVEALAYSNKSDSTALKQPIHDVFLFPFKDGKYLFQRRKKIPFMGILMPIGSKITSGMSIFETAERKLFRDSGLMGDLKFKGIIDVKTFRDGELFLHHVLNVFRIAELEGVLKENCDKGENVFLGVDDYLKEENIMSGFKEQLAVAECENFMYLELKQFMEGDKFSRVEIVRKVEF